MWKFALAVLLSFGIAVTYGYLKANKTLGDPATSTLGDYGPIALVTLLGGTAIYFVGGRHKKA